MQLHNYIEQNAQFESDTTQDAELQIANLVSTRRNCRVYRKIRTSEPQKTQLPGESYSVKTYIL